MLDLSDPIRAVMEWIAAEEEKRKAVGIPIASSNDIYACSFDDLATTADALLAKCKVQTVFEQEQLIDPYEYIAGVL